jgi:hypothetical protein
MNRTTSTQVTFIHPFRLDDVEGMLPAGTYTVETEEELLQSISFPVWQRVASVILLPRRAAVSIEPATLAAALALDALETI